MFDPIVYFEQLHTELNILADKYKFTKVSGIGALEEVLESSRRNNYFFAVDDSQDGTTFRSSGAYFERRPYTVFILGKADYGDMTKRAEVLEEAKTIYRHLMSRLIKDKTTIPMLDMERIRFYEVPPAFATGCSGVYFIFNVENPVDLTFDEEAWTI